MNHIIGVTDTVIRVVTLKLSRLLYMAVIYVPQS